MFEDDYKKAYNLVTPSQELSKKTMEMAENTGAVRKTPMYMKAVAAVAVLFLCVFSAVPVCAAHIPAFYRIIEFISPALSDRLVPVEESSTSQGIIMEVEAVDLQDNEAEIIISLRDDGKGQERRIDGPADLFDSYTLSDYANESIVGGCSFLTYDEEMGKAYFKVTVQSDHAYRADKLHFSVREILCNKYSESKEIDLSEVTDFAETKRVILSGRGGLIEESALPEALREVPGTSDDSRPGQMVLDFMDVKDCAPDDFTITGMAYMDGVLRVQMCMGDNWHVDRHVELFLKDAYGNERYNDCSVSWQEEVGDTSYQFYEFWYLENTDNIEDYSMYGIFHSSGESVEGEWDVTFRVG